MLINVSRHSCQLLIKRLDEAAFTYAPRNFCQHHRQREFAQAVNFPCTDLRYVEAGN